MTDRREPQVWLLVATAGLAILLPLITIADLQFPGRPLLALAYLLLVPGGAMPVLLQTGTGALGWAVIMAVSISCTLIVATSMTLAGVLTTLAVQGPLSALGLVAVALAGRRLQQRAEVPA